MPDTKLTDLEIITQPDNGDVLYIVDVDQDASKQITYNNLVGTRFDQLSTSFDALSSDVDIQIADLDTNVTTLQNDLIDTNINVNTLSSTAFTLSGQVQDLSAAVFTDNDQFIVSAVDGGSFSFGTDLTIANNSSIKKHVTTYNTQIGDASLIALSAEGGLSGIFTNFYSLSDNSMELYLYNVTGLSVTIPASTPFNYNITRYIPNPSYNPTI